MAKSKIKYTSAKDWAEKQDKGFDRTSVKPPEGVEFFTFKKVGTYKIDIIPYVVGKGNPEAEEGFAHCCRTYFCHRGLGLEGKDTYVCRARTFKKRCPVCEWLMAEGGNADKELVKKLRPKTRQIWNVVDCNDKEKGIQLFDQSYFMGFGEQLKELIETSPEEFENFYHLDGGLSIQLKVSEKTSPFGTIKAISRIDFLPRKKALPDSLLEEAICLDDCLVDVGYEELKKIFLQQTDDSDDSDDDETPVRKGRARPDPDDSDEDESENDEDSDESDEDEAPVAKKRKTVTEDDSDETDSEDENEEPVRRPVRKSRIQEDDESEDEPLKRKPTKSRYQDDEDIDETDDEDNNEDADDSDEDESSPRRRSGSSRR